MGKSRMCYGNKKGGKCWVYSDYFLFFKILFCSSFPVKRNVDAVCGPASTSLNLINIQPIYKYLYTLFYVNISNSEVFCASICRVCCSWCKPELIGPILMENLEF